MEQLLDNQLKSQQHQRKGNRSRVKRNYDKNSLFLHTAKLHNLSKQLFQLKVIKSNNRTTAQFFSTTCYRRLKIPKRRRQFNVIRVVILFLILVFVYLCWHRNLFSTNENNVDKKFVKKYRPTNSQDFGEENVNLKQIDEEKTNNLQEDLLEEDAQNKLAKNTKRKDDQKDLVKDLERQHLFLDSTSRTNNDRSSLKLDFNTQYESDPSKQITKRFNSNNSLNSISFISSNGNKKISVQAKFNNKKIQNDDHRIKSSILSTNITSQLPAHIISKAIINPEFKNYSFLDQISSCNPLVSKCNQSSLVSIFPDEQRKKSKSILEKQLAWYEIVGITMFNLLESSFASQKMNLKFKNYSTIRPTEQLKNEIQSNIETSLTKPLISSSVITYPSLDQKHLKTNLKTNLQSNDTLTVKEKSSNSSKSNQTSSSSSNFIKNLERRLPKCIIVGVRKAGTRAVLEYLALNDHIKKADNEVHFFDNDERYSLGLDYYRNQMPFSALEQITIEKSPAYFVTSSVPERIKAMNASIKLILIVRDPVVRLISDYTQLTHNKLLKLDDLMRISGTQDSNRLKFEQKQQPKQENHLFEFLIESKQQKQKKYHYLEKQANNKIVTRPTMIMDESNTMATNEQSAFIKQKNEITDINEYNLKKKKIEKNIDENTETKKFISDDTIGTLVNTDYWNRIESEPDYRKREQLDDDEEEDDDDTFVSLPIVKQKRQIVVNFNENRMNKISNLSVSTTNTTNTTITNSTLKSLKMSNEGSNKQVIKRIAKSIDFKDSTRDSKFIDLTTTRQTKKLKSNKFENRKRSNLKIEKSISKTKQKINIIKKSKQKLNRPNRQVKRGLDDEDENYRSYKELNADDEDLKLDNDYLSFEKDRKETIDHNVMHNKNLDKQNSITTSNIDQVEKKINQNEDDDDYHHNWKIPKFEELVVRNGQVNTNYKPVKTSIYSLHMDNWLRVFHRDQIHIVDGDKLIKEPHVELNKIETFLGLPNQIHRDQFVFNKKKNFFCARMYQTSNDNNYFLNGNSSTSWRRKTKITNKNLNKTTGRHSSIRCLNSSKGRKHPQVDKQVITKLRLFYAPFNRHFERLVNMKFDWPEI